MGSALRTLRMIQAAMLVSIILLVYVGEKFPHIQQPPNPTIFYALSFVSISLIGAIFVVRRTLVTGSDAELVKRPSDAIVIARWKSAYVIIFALCEALALFGFTLRMLGFGLVHIWVFYLGGFALMLCFSPRISRAQT